MVAIRYSGNEKDPGAFSVQDMDHLIQSYNETIDAILFVTNYTNRTTKAMFDQALAARGIESLGYCDKFPYNQLISCVGMANDLHRSNNMGPYESFSSLASLKIRNGVTEYEETYSKLTRELSVLHWAF